MPTTTLHKRLTEMQRGTLHNCHDGSGDLDWTVVLGGTETAGRFVRFIHRDRLPPGVSIGDHRHEDTEEYYYVVAGEGTMTLDGDPIPVAAGDVTAVYPGGIHGLKNTGRGALDFVVICAAAPKPSAP